MDGDQDERAGERERGRGGGATRARTPASRGTDLLLRKLSTGTTQNIGNVGQYDFDDSGNWLAYTVDSESKLGNGVYVVNLATGDTRALDNSSLEYDALAWATDSKALLALRGETPKGKTLRENVLVVWSDASQGGPTVWDPSKDSSFPQGYVLSEMSAPRWSRDTGRIFVGIKAQAETVVESTEPKANLDIWHWKDVELQSQQILGVAQARRATFASVYDVGAKRFVRLTASPVESVTPAANGKVAIVRDPSPYNHDYSEGAPSRADYYKIDTATGTRTPIAKHVLRTMGTSTDSQSFLYLAGTQIIAVNLETMKATTIGSTDAARFINTDDDHAAEKPLWGVAGWSKDGKAVLLNDKHDVWSGAARRRQAHEPHGGSGRRAVDRVPAHARPFGRRRRWPRRAAGGGGGGGAAGEDAGIDLTQPLTLHGHRRVDEEIRLLEDAGRRRHSRRRSSGSTRTSAAFRRPRTPTASSSRSRRSRSSRTTG